MPAHSGQFSTFRVIIFTGAKQKEEQTAEMVRGEEISIWLAVFEAPGIIAVCNYSIFLGDLPKNFALPAV